MSVKALKHWLLKSFLFLFGILAGLPLWASNFFFVDGFLYDNSDRLVLDNVSFVVQIVNQSADPTLTCVLYQEAEQAKDLVTSQGEFRLSVGQNKQSGIADDFQKVFANNGVTYTGLDSISGGSSCEFTATAGSQRILRIIAEDSAMVQDVILMEMGSVPKAMVAETLNGLPAEGFIQVNPGQNLTQANLETIFNQFIELDALLSGSSTQYITANANGTSSIPLRASDPTADLAAGQMWFDNQTNEIKYHDGTEIQTVGASSKAIVQSDIPELTDAGNGVAPSALTSGTIGNGIGINTDQNIITSATLSAATLNASEIRLFDGGQDIRLNAPVGLSQDYNLTLPVDAGTAGDLLTTNGSGVLSWTPASESNAFLKGGNTVQADALLGTNSAHPLKFRTNSTNHMTLSADGNFGIGVPSSPENAFHLRRDGGGNGASPIYPMKIEGYAGNNHNYLVMKNTNSGAGARGTGLRILHDHSVHTPIEREKAILMYENQTNQWRFYASDGAASELGSNHLKMVISHSGNVGIGDSALTNRLNVVSDDPSSSVIASFRSTARNGAMIDFIEDAAPSSTVSIGNKNGNLSLEPVSGIINVNSSRIGNLVDPEYPSDAATKNYVDKPVALIVAQASTSEEQNFGTNSWGLPQYLEFQSEIFDDGNIWDSGQNAINTPGTYRINLNLLLNTSANGSLKVVFRVKIGPQSYYLGSVHRSSGGEVHLSGSLVFTVPGGQAAKLEVDKTIGSDVSITVKRESNLSIEKLR